MWKDKNNKVDRGEVGKELGNESYKGNFKNGLKKKVGWNLKIINILKELITILELWMELANAVKCLSVKIVYVQIT